MRGHPEVFIGLKASGDINHMFNMPQVLLSTYYLRAALVKDKYIALLSRSSSLAKVTGPRQYSKNKEGHAIVRGHESL